jgi:hypothetical protein
LPQKRFSIIIVPPENGRVINREISQRLLIICSLFISCFIVASLYSAISFLRSTVDHQKMAGLTEENQVLTAKIGNLESTVSILQSEMSKIVSKDENIRMVFDLPPIDSDIREVGIGGDVAMTPEIQSELGERTWMVEEDIEKIRRQLELENASFDDLYPMIQQRKVTLDHTPTINPCDGFVTRGFGMHNDPFTGAYQRHNGIDIAAPKGTPVYATAEGIVMSTSYESGLGNVIIIDHGQGLSTTYGHLSKVMVPRGYKVKRGEEIGLVGSTGYSTGPHLHYEVHTNGRAVDPSDYIVKSILSLL